MYSKFSSLTGWAGRVTGAVLTIVLFVFAVGHGGLPNLSGAPAGVMLQFASLVTILVGYGLGWKWEAVGGVAVLIGFAAFNMAELTANGAPAGGMIPLLIVPGLLYLTAACFRHCGRNRLTRSSNLE